MYIDELLSISSYFNKFIRELDIGWYLECRINLEGKDCSAQKTREKYLG